MRDCKHGNLARSCELCEKDARIAALESALKTAEEALEKLCHDPSQWRRGGAGGQDKYAGLPPGMRFVDAALAAIKEARHG